MAIGGGSRVSWTSEGCSDPIRDKCWVLPIRLRGIKTQSYLNSNEDVFWVENKPHQFHAHINCNFIFHFIHLIIMYNNIFHTCCYYWCLSCNQYNHIFISTSILLLLLLQFLIFIQYACNCIRFSCCIIAIYIELLVCFVSLSSYIWFNVVNGIKGKLSFSLSHSLYLWIEKEEEKLSITIL